MDFYGHINLQNNEMRQMAFALETDFPATPAVGRTVFKHQTLYMCVALNGVTPIWIPMTNTINLYKHTQSVAATQWTVAHDLLTTSPAVQVYDSNDNLIIPDDVTIVDDSNLTIDLSTTMTGKAVIISGDEIPADGIGILAPESYSYEQDFTAVATIVVNHNLGYYPIIRLFVGGVEAQPQSVTHDSIFQATIVLSSPQTGTIRAI